MNRIRAIVGSPFVFLALSGCCTFGPCDGAIFVPGMIQGGDDQSCELLLRHDSGKHTPQIRQVSGRLDEGFVIQTFRVGHTITVILGEMLMGSKTIHYDKDLEIGGEVPFGEVLL